jgi:TonB-dependent SusC/RagA subfamily outer membrane receptor
MSNHTLSPRALVALVGVPLATSLACASGGPKDTRPSSPQQSTDTSSVANADGKSMEDLFVGRFPGVTVSRTTGGGLQIRIRGGSNTFYGSDEPLYVVDDTPLAPGSGGILFLNPYDIQKIEVLKNPADIAMYGIRGGNGVVKITTKRSRQ